MAVATSLDYLHGQTIMSILAPDIEHLSKILGQTARELSAAFAQARVSVSPDQPDPQQLVKAMERLVDVLQRLESDAQSMSSLSGNASQTSQALPGGLTQTDINQLGDYGLNLLNELATHARGLKLAEQSRHLQDLAFPFALWVAHHGGEISTLEPVVNAIAVLANRINDSAELAELFSNMSEIVAAIAPTIRQDLDKSNPGRPWRLLVLNLGIVATRSHNPRMMEAAFEALILNLPEEAPEFFREGMHQMQALNYPKHVREVMERYFREWSAGRVLH